jgi:hypothetical protein
VNAEQGYGKTERGLAEEAKAEWDYKGGALISFTFCPGYLIVISIISILAFSSVIDANDTFI